MWETYLRQQGRGTGFRPQTQERECDEKGDAFLSLYTKPKTRKAKITRAKMQTSEQSVVDGRVSESKIKLARLVPLERAEKLVATRRRQHRVSLIMRRY